MSQRFWVAQRLKRCDNRRVFTAALAAEGALTKRNEFFRNLLLYFAGTTHRF